MWNRPPIGSKLYTDPSFSELQIVGVLGGGGQGEVYEVRRDDVSLAVKWYLDPSLATGKWRKNIEENIQKGAPDSSFLWPTSIVTNRKGSPQFGYLMRKAGENFAHMGDIIRESLSTTLHALLTATFNLARCFRNLHAQGLCYQDINLGNAKLNPRTGEVIVMDCDNVTVEGRSIGAFTTPSFAAREVWVDGAMPTRQSDLYSLAVFLYQMLMRHHPMLGRRELDVVSMDRDTLYRLMIVEPLFMFDPNDPSNAPHPKHHKAPLFFWHWLPSWIRDLFTTTFTAGIKDPSKRAAELAWQDNAIRARDAIMYCSHCGLENFFDLAAIQANQGAIPACHVCAKEFNIPPRLRIDGNTSKIVLLHDNRELFPHHTDRVLFDFSKPTARVVARSTGEKALLNQSAEKWTVTIGGGSAKEIPPQQTVELVNGLTIHFGKARGEVRL